MSKAQICNTANRECDDARVEGKFVYCRSKNYCGNKDVVNPRSDG